jgi:hypothetical protein
MTVTNLINAFYGVVPVHPEGTPLIEHKLGSENIVSVSVWYLPPDGYGEGERKQLVSVGVTVRDPNTIKLHFTNSVLTSNAYEVAILAI